MATPQEEYAAAWDEDELEQPVVEEETPVAEEPEPEPEPPEEESETPVDEPPVEDSAPTPEEEEKTWKQKYKSWEGRYKKEREMRDAQLAALQAEIAELKAKSAEPPKPVEPDEDEQFLEKFKQEYEPGVLRAIEIMAGRKAKEMASQVDSRLAPLQQTAQQQAQALHFAALDAGRPGWEPLVQSDEFTQWVDAQPSLLRNVYRATLERGQAQDILDVFKAYDAAHPAVPTRTTHSIDPAKAQAATAVRSKRGSIPKPKGAEDYASAWDEAPETI